MKGAAAEGVVEGRGQSSLTWEGFRVKGRSEDTRVGGAEGRWNVGK